MAINKKDRKKFSIFQGRGIRMTFENGYTISIQFGKYSYCDHYMDATSADITDQQAGEIGSNTAEVAIYDSRDNFINLGDPLEGHHDVRGYLKPNDVLKLMNYAANLPSIEESL